MIDQLVTLREASELTRLSVSWWRRAVAHGRVASIKLGRSIRIRQSEIERVLVTSERPTVGQTDSTATTEANQG